LGSWAAPTGTIGKPIVGPHEPPRFGAGNGSPPVRLISAAELHGPRLPASVVAVSRTYCASTGGNTTVWVAGLSPNFPALIRVVQCDLSSDVSILYEPIRPFLFVDGRGR